MESREKRIAALAATLKTSGIAKSEAQAKMMAEDMVGVEEHVQKSYEEKHTEAHEYLKTAKNLGTPRQKIKVEPVVPSKAESRYDGSKSGGSKLVEPLAVDSVKSSKAKTSDLPPAYTDLQFSGKTLNQAFDHNTHNAALESIKAQISNMPLDSVESHDSVIDSVGLDNSDDVVESVGESDAVSAVDDVSESIAPEVVPKAKSEVIMQDIDEMIEAPEAPKGIEPVDSNIIEDVSDTSVVDDVVEQVKENVVEQINEDLDVSSEDLADIETGAVDGDSSDVIKDVADDASANVVEDVKDSVEDEKDVVEDAKTNDLLGTAAVSVAAIPEIESVESAESNDVSKSNDVPESPKLDAQKLVEMMEEEGELEEHTREIKEKPKNAKPKEDYVENSIDLSDVFNYAKR